MTPSRRAFRLSIVLGLLMLAQSVAGLLLSEQYRDPAWIKAAWFGADWITLVVAVPLLLAGLGSAARGSTRGLLLWLGVVGYGVYNYAFYLFGAALNTFFPLYVAAFTVAVIVLGLALVDLDVGAARWFRATTAAAIVGGYLIFIAIGLTCAWIALWAAYVFAGRPTPVEPEAFKVVAALDLSLMAPALAAGGVLLLLRRPWGPVVAAIAAVQGSLYLLALSAGSIVAVRRGLAASPGELPIWGTLLACTAAATLLLLAHVRGSAPRGAESRSGLRPAPNAPRRL
jgi:hypothetical protein